MSEPRRPLRALFVANDGLGAGHVTRAIAIARAFLAATPAGSEARWLLATTSEADALLSALQVPAVRLPSTGATRRQNLALSEYRQLNEKILRGVIDGFAPDLLVVDTFPAGPHLELAPLVERVPRRVLVQRTVKPRAREEAEMTTARGLYHLTLVPDDPTPQSVGWRGLTRVAPVTLELPRLPREQARQRLGLEPDDRVALVCPGGGGDAEAVSMAVDLGRRLEARGYRVFAAHGPLAPGPLPPPCPLSPLLEAFDVAFAAAGYNTAHELAAARIKTALFARPRAFDDQPARARRFASAGHAVALDGAGDDDIDQALERLATLAPPGLAVHGAREAAAHLWRLMLGEKE